MSTGRLWPGPEEEGRQGRQGRDGTVRGGVNTEASLPQAVGGRPPLPAEVLVAAAGIPVVKRHVVTFHAVGFLVAALMGDGARAKTRPRWNPTLLSGRRGEEWRTGNRAPPTPAVRGRWPSVWSLGAFGRSLSGSRNRRGRTTPLTQNQAKTDASIVGLSRPSGD